MIRPVPVLPRRGTVANRRPWRTRCLWPESTAGREQNALGPVLGESGMGPETDAAILLYANDKWLISIVFILEGMDADTYETIVDGVVDSIILVD